MHTRSLWRALILVVIVAAVVVFTGTLIHAVFYAPDSEIPVPPSALTATSTSTPKRLQIPSLNINANVQQVGITKAGDMGVPNNFTDVAWYKYGPVPGQLGSSVIDGHVDNALSLDGVFKHLNQIKIGDDVYVVAADGTRMHFRVIDIESYPYTSAPSSVIFGQTDAARLNLITCSGTWIQSVKSYSNRTVVYTKFVDSISTGG